MTSPFVEPLPKKKRKKGPDDEITKNVVVLKSSQVREMVGVVLMPKTTLDMSEIKKLGQSRKITFTKNTSSGDLQRKLEEKFPFLKEASGRFYCAKAVENRSKLDFCGDRCVWSGAFINKNITGNSALYIYCEEEKEGDSGHYSSDSDLSVAPVYGNCLVTAASQGRKRFQSEPRSAAEGLHVIDDETLRAVESQKCGTVIESDKNYTFCGQLEDVKISSVPQAIQLQDVKTCSATQVTEKEASVCALTVEREQHQCSVLIAPEAEKEQIQDFGQLSTDLMQSGEHFILSPVCSNRSDVTKIVPMTLPPALQPTLPTGDLPEQINSSTLASYLRSLQISSRDTEIQKSYDQASIETFTAKGSQSAQQLRQPQYPKTQVPANEASISALTKDNQQNTSGTIGAFDDQIIELLASFECEANSSAQNLMDVARREEWLKQYDYEVVINPKESPLQGGAPCIFTFKPELPSDVDVKASFGNIEPIILVKTILGYICKIPASPKMTPEVIKVWLISTTTGEILAETSLEYYRVLYVRKNLGGKPGACGSGRREDEGNDGGASGGGASGGRASGGRSSGGGSSGEGAGGSGVSGDGTGGTGAGGCGGKGCGSYGGGATGCQYRIEASQLGSDVVSKLCEFIQKCSVGRQEPSATQNKACTEAEEDLEDDQLLCTQESNENYFADTEDCSSVSSETDSALSDSESWDESLSDSPLSFAWVNSRSSKSQEAIPETESTQHSHEAVNSKLNVSHEILELMMEGFTSEDSIGNNNYVGSGVCHKWNTSLPESKKTEENREKDDHNKMQDSSQEWAFFSEGRTSHIQLASHDDTPELWFDALDLIAENEESQNQDNELFEAPHAENTKPKDSESILSVTLNQQSATHAGPTTQSQAAQSPVSNPLWNGDSKLNMAPLQCSDEEIHSGQEWEESGEGLASWFDLCENEDAGKNEHSRWEMSSIEPNKTDGGVEKDVFDSEKDLSQEQGLFSEQGNSHVHLSLPDDTSVQSRRPEVENEEIQDTSLFTAARNSQTDIVRLLIQSRADVNKGGLDTPLCEAVRNGHTDIVRLLIENGADVNEGWDTPLCEAARNGHTDIVRLLIENRADVNKGGPDTPLCKAARNGHTDIVRLLIENGADINKAGRIIKCTPLSEAARSGHTDIVRLLIKNGADLNKDTPLCEAAKNGHTDIVRLLIENRADVNKEGQDTPLCEAARNGHTDIVRLLIESRADVNKGGPDTPLCEAARNGHTDVVRLLIENGADVNEGWDTSLCKAARNGHTDIVRLLIENGADVNKGGSDTPLCKAARNGHTDIVRLLIVNGADINKAGGIIECTPLSEAARNGHTDIVRLLIENGADLNKDTPLCKAERNGHIDIVRLLIENGADVNKEGWGAPLPEAARNGHTDIVRLLIENGADVNKAGQSTPLCEAAINGHTDIVRLLIENGADVNKEGWITGGHPLSEAARNGHTDIVRLLIENGADVNKREQVFKRTPLSEAAGNGHTDIVRLLIENGADVNKAGLDTPLCKAARNGHTDIVRLLIENGADINKAGRISERTLLSEAARNGHTEIDTPLCEAARNGHTDIVRLLIENGADVNKGWIYGGHPLSEAARNGHTDIVRLLIENGADFNKGGWRAPLFEAARNGHTDIVRLLIKNGADVNQIELVTEGPGIVRLLIKKAAYVNEEGQETPLCEASKNGHTDIVRLLIENGADVNKGGETPLCKAARNGHTDILRLLIENGADVSKGRGDTPLFEAARNGHTDIVRLLIENGADVDIGGRDTPLFETARNGHTGIVRLLIENGADVNRKGRSDTPLVEAASNGHPDILRLLIENGADVNKEEWDTLLTAAAAARNYHTKPEWLIIENKANVNKERKICERTLVTVAVRNGHTDIVRLRKENGADINKGGGICERTPVAAAARNGHTDIVRLLKENGADINKGGGVSSPTPLAEAAGNGHIDIVKFLLENGADVNKGWATPLNEAVINDHADIVGLLIENGADVNKGRGFFRHSPLREAVRTGNSDIVKLLVDNGADFNVTSWSAIEMKLLGRILRRNFDADARAVIQIKLLDECLRGMFEADARDTKLSLERELDVQLKGKKTASLPKSPGKKLKTQTEMTSPRDIVEEGKCGKDSMADVELGLNCLHVSPRREQFKPYIMEESPGDFSITYHDFKPINKSIDRVTLTDVGNAKQGHCVVVEKAKTHPNGDTIIIYGRKINEEGSGVGEAFQLATKDLKGTWEDEEVVAENVQVGSVVKYVQVGDEFLFQGNTKRPRWDMERTFLDLSCTDGAHRSIGDAFPSSKLLAVDSCQDCTPKETSYFSSLKCDVVENDRISVITKLWELLNLKLNYREDVIPSSSPSTLELSHVEVNKDIVDGAVLEMREPLLISGVDGLSKPSYPVVSEGLNLRDEPKETSVEAENPEADPKEKDDEDGDAF